MQDVTITELESNMSFEAKIDNPPEIKQNYTTVYIDEKMVKRPNISQTNGLIEIKLVKPDKTISDFVTNWFKTRKRINLMAQNDEHMYFMKGCSIKRFTSPEKAFIVFYNNFKEA